MNEDKAWTLPIFTTVFSGRQRQKLEVSWPCLRMILIDLFNDLDPRPGHFRFHSLSATVFSGSNWKRSVLAWNVKMRTPKKEFCLRESSFEYFWHQQSNSIQWSRLINSKGYVKRNIVPHPRVPKMDGVEWTPSSLAAIFQTKYLDERLTILIVCCLYLMWRKKSSRVHLLWNKNICKFIFTAHKLSQRKLRRLRCVIFE